MDRKIKTKVGFTGKVEELSVRVPDSEPDPWGADANLRVVGTDVPRVDAPLKVTGRAKYTYDVHPKGMLYGKILRSPWGCARIKSIDLQDAEKLAGVKAVHVHQREGTRLLFNGEEIAGVAAVSDEIAKEALRRIKIDYEVLPCVVTVDDAMKPSATRVFEKRGNVRREGDPETQDVAGALREADKIIEATYMTQVQTHSCLETHGVLVRWEKDGSITVWSSTQATFGVRDQVANRFDLDRSSVRVLAEHVGGGFGSKFSFGPYGLIAAELARKAEAPVRIMLDRAEEHQNGGNRPSSIQKMKGGVTKDGRIVGLEVVSHGTSGVGGGAGVSNPMIYNVGAIRKEEYVVYTNAGSGCAMRAPGHPQGAFALESFMDEMADAIGMDPLEFRKKNDPSPVRQAQYDLGAKKIGWKEKRKKSGTGVLKRGVGMASGIWYQKGTQATVQITVHKDGIVEVLNGAQDIGTGTRTVLAVIAAEELTLNPHELVVRMGDTRHPFGPGSGGSCTAPSVGPACRVAAIAAKKELLKIVSEKRGVRSEELDFRDGKIARGASVLMTFKEACGLMSEESITVLGKRAKNYPTWQDTVGGVQFAEVEVDAEMGRIFVRKIVAIQDAGRVVDKLLFESQIVGGVIQGISYALFEERIIDRKTGVVLNPDFLNYKIAGPKDMPEIIPIAFDVANAGNNVGMMGLGEPPVIPTAAAIANAVAHALGVRVRELPMTPDKVLAVLT